MLSTQIDPPLLVERHMPGTEILISLEPFPLLGCVALRSLRAVKGNTNVG